MIKIICMKCIKFMQFIKCRSPIQCIPKKLILKFEILMGVSVSQLSNQIRTMFAHLRINPEAKYRVITHDIAAKMRDRVRTQTPLLTGIDSSKDDVANILAEIYMREFGCAIRTLQQVNYVAGRYHEHAFDNTDAYIIQDQDQDQMPMQSHEMNAEQRHAAQLLLGVGNSYSGINTALRMLDVSLNSVMDCNSETRVKLSQQFSANAAVVEDAFDRLQHDAKQVWSLVNMLALSNLFRFADPRQPVCIPNQDDAIFIPYIPTQVKHAF